jgi:hypothetical protein
MIYYKEVLDFLKEIDVKLKGKITLTAVGGTAMVFMGLKESTKDIDFCIENKHYKEFLEAKTAVKEKFRVDLFKDGYIFCQQLPEDYISISRPLKEDFKNIELRLLHPIDIILTKAARLNERDKEDIALLTKKKKILKERLIKRFKVIKKSCPSSDRDLEYHFNWLLKTFFKS